MCSVQSAYYLLCDDDLLVYCVKYFKRIKDGGGGMSGDKFSLVTIFQKGPLNKMPMTIEIKLSYLRLSRQHFLNLVDKF